MNFLEVASLAFRHTRPPAGPISRLFVMVIWRGDMNGSSRRHVECRSQRTATPSERIGWLPWCKAIIINLCNIDLAASHGRALGGGLVMDLHVKIGIVSFRTDIRSSLSSFNYLFPPCFSIPLHKRRIQSQAAMQYGQPAKKDLPRLPFC